jgi:hypothetical protein
MTTAVAGARAASLALAIAVFLSKGLRPVRLHVPMAPVHGIAIGPAATRALDGHDEAGAGVPMYGATVWPV